MDNKIDHIDFLNSVESILEEFIKETMLQEFNEEVYAVFDYEDINKIFIDNLAPPKPAFHFWHETPQGNQITNVSQSAKGQKVYMSYTVFCVVDDSVESEQKRKTILNRYTSHLKYVFENYQKKLDEFKNIKISLGSNDVQRNEDQSIYAMKQDLSFQIIKRK